MENPIKMDDLGVPLFSETSTTQYLFDVASRALIVFQCWMHAFVPGEVFSADG